MNKSSDTSDLYFQNYQSTTEMRDNEQCCCKLEVIPKLPQLKVQNINFFPTSSYTFLLISIGLFISGCQETGWFKYGPTFMNATYFCIGIGLYIFGIFDFYQEKNIFCLQNIIFAFWYISYFFDIFEINGLKNPNKSFNYLQYVSDLVMSIFVSIIVIISKGLGKAYIIDYSLLLLCYLSRSFSNHSKLFGKIYGYTSFVTFIFFWITGLSLVINYVFNKKIIRFVEPQIN